MRIVIVDHPGSGAPSFSALQDIAVALNTQVTRDFCPAYDIAAPASVVALAAGASPLPTDWIIGLFKDPDQPGALGYHDMTPHGLPLAKVFPLLDKEDGGELSVTISHELLEMLADPYLSLAAQGDDGRFWAYEVCDAVENDQYEIGGVKVSNFVTPAYFQPPQETVAGMFDQLGLVKAPYEVRPGGYMQWNKGGGWHQVVHREVAPRAYRTRTEARASRRAISRGGKSW